MSWVVRPASHSSEQNDTPENVPFRPKVSAFADRVERQIFSPSTPLEIIAGCLGFVREQAVKTQEQGLDITYMLDNRFRRNIERTVSGVE